MLDFDIVVSVLEVLVEILLLYSHMQYHNDTIIETQEDFFNKYVPLTLL